MTKAMPIRLDGSLPRVTARQSRAGRALPGALASATLVSARDIDGEFLAAWRALEEAAAEPNIFYESRFLVPALRHCDPRDKVRLFLLWEGLPNRSRLLGLMPVVAMSLYGKWRIPHVQNWLHYNAFLGTPLIRSGHERVMVRHLWHYQDAHAGSALFFHFNALALDGPFARALSDVAHEQGRRCDVVHSHQRALLASDLSAEAYCETHIRTKKRKELRRQKRRLEEMGTLAFARSDGRQGLEHWIDEFLQLEAAGWKGYGNSALGAADDTRALFNDMLRAMAGAGKLELLDLRFEGAPIAMLINLLSAPGAFSFKTAFDESFARFSPGVLLQIENYAMLEREGIAWTDSCAAEDHPMIDSLWAERRTIGRVSVAIGGGARRSVFAGLRKVEDMRASRSGGSNGR